MTPKQYYKDKSGSVIRRMCKDAGTSVMNFKQIAISKGSCGKGLAERLANNSRGAMTELEILYPERYGDSRIAEK